MKVLNVRKSEWSYVIEVVLFAHRVSRHSSTKYTPLFLMYHQQPVLPIDIQYSLNTINDAEVEYPFNRETLDTVLSGTLSLRQKAHQKANENIMKAQKKQQWDYNRRLTLPTSLKVKNKVWLKNQRRLNRKDGKFSYKWLGHYVIENISKKGLCTNQSGVELSKKYNAAILKPYLDPVNPADDVNKHVPLDERPPNLQDADPHKPGLQNLEGALQQDSNSSAHRHADAKSDYNRKVTGSNPARRSAGLRDPTSL